MSSPSFSQLFQRSRYVRSAMLGIVDAQRQKRLEVFSVAAVGFALQHDQRFKLDFLKRFVGIEDANGDWDPRLQAADCTDLLLENRKRNILVVAEFKVWSPIQPHQNPWDQDRNPFDATIPFWSKMEKEEGYGYQLGNKKKYDQFSTIYYIVTGKNGTRRHENAYTYNKKTFLLRRRTWGSLLPPNSELVKDLVTSLGELGIEELEDWHVKTINPNTTSKAVEACFEAQSVFQVLQLIAKKLGRQKLGISDIRWDTDGAPRNFGFGLRKKELERLSGDRKDFCKAHYEQWTPWLGYVSNHSEEGFQPEIWFYVGKGMKTRLLGKLKSELGNRLATFPDPPDTDDPKNCIRIRRSKDSQESDVNWFCTALGLKTDE